jgi:hypothetical protein
VKGDLFPAGQSFLNNSSGSFVSNQIVFWSNRYQIEIESYQKVFTTCWLKIELNRNQFDLTALPLISRWELDKFKNCRIKSFRTSKILTLFISNFRTWFFNEIWVVQD